MLTKNKRLILIFAILIIALFLVFGVYWVLYLKKVHSTFENYYAFRGCQKLLEKTMDYGICQLKSGATIKLVKFKNKWYLAGDLPYWCWHNICFGI